MIDAICKEQMVTSAERSDVMAAQLEKVNATADAAIDSRH
jgi:hypothetical protein